MAKSLQQFREWAIIAKSTGNPSGGSYHGECVSLIQQYVNQVFNQPYKARGHAYYYVPPTFKRMPANTKLKPGDIVRYGTNYGYGYGHIGMIDDRGLYLDQNGVVARKIGTRKTPFIGIESVWRPTKKFNVKTPKPKSKLVVGKRTARKGTATVTVSALNVRDKASTKGKVVDTYKKGGKFKYDSYIITNGYVWLSYIGGQSGKRRYVAEGPYDGKKSTVYLKGGIS